MIESETVRVDSVSDYPKMMINNSGFVVLFSSACKGFVVHGVESQDYSVGYYSCAWNMDMFKDLEKGLTVSITQC